MNLCCKITLKHCFVIPGCLCLCPLWSKEAFPFRVPNATLQSAETPSNTRKALSSPRPCRFIISIAILPNLWNCTLCSAPYFLIPLSGALLPLRWYLAFFNQNLVDELPSSLAEMGPVVDTHHQLATSLPFFV